MADIIYNGEVEKKCITDQFCENLAHMLKTDRDVVYLDGDLMFCYGQPLWDLADEYPERVLRCGIAEANMVGTAAALSVQGKKPIIHTFAAFVARRAFDQVFISGAYAHKTLNIIGSQPGYVQTCWGGTHDCFEDTAIMRTIPNGYIFDIVDGVQFNKLISRTVNMKGIYYYRTPLADNIAVYGENQEFEIGKGIVLRDGEDATVIAAGRLVTLALEAAELLAAEGIHIRVVDMFTIKPLDEDLVIQCAKDTGAIVTAENASAYGGLGGAVAECLSENYPVVVERIGTHNQFGEVGDEAYLRGRFGFNPDDIAAKVKLAISKKRA
ncbi:MAG: transketolase family protein [Bilifractor sp.]|jgi:transketolase|nr:transketolase C-terminal domain-containing protein [Lachnospiraceae bacterium]